MTLFLDGLFLALVLYVITQIFLPFIFPADLERNWLFKRKNKTEGRISEIKKAKRNFSNQADAALTEAERKIKESKELKNSIKKS